VRWFGRTRRSAHTLLRHNARDEESGDREQVRPAARPAAETSSGARTQPNDRLEEIVSPHLLDLPLLASQPQ
jgi:hypothetical protein